MLIKVKITPNAKKSELIGIDQDLFGEEIYKIRISAPPKEGKANQELIKFLSDYFDTAKSNIEIIKGETSRTKLIGIKN